MPLLKKQGKTSNISCSLTESYSGRIVKTSCLQKKKILKISYLYLKRLRKKIEMRVCAVMLLVLPRRNKRYAPPNGRNNCKLFSSDNDTTAI